MNTRIENTVALVWIVIALAVPWPCQADIKQDARKRFGEGVELVQKQDYQGGLTAFKESYRLYPNGTTLINIAMCLKELGRYVESIAAFERFLADAGDEGDAQKRQVAEATIAQINQVLANIELNGEPTDVVTPNTQPDGEEGSAVQDVSPESANATAQVQPTPSVEEERSKDPSGLFIGGIVATGIGVAAGTLGVVFTAKGYQDFDEAKKTDERANGAWTDGDIETTSRLDAKYENYRRDVLPTDRAWMIAGYTAAGICLTTGVVLFILDAKKERYEALALTPAPGGLAVGF